MSGGGVRVRVGVGFTNEDNVVEDDSTSELSKRLAIPVARSTSNANFEDPRYA